MAALMLMAAVAPTFPSATARSALCAILLATTFFRVAWIAEVWTGRQSDLTQLLAATRAIEPGAAVLTVQQDADWRTAPRGTFVMGSPGGPRPAARHFGSLLVVENHAFVPSLFAIPGQHVLKVMPPWRERAQPFQKVPYAWALASPRSGAALPDSWRRDFDYLVLLDADLSRRQRWTRTAFSSSPAMGSLACTASASARAVRPRAPAGRRRPRVAANSRLLGGAQPSLGTCSGLPLRLVGHALQFLLAHRFSIDFDAPLSRLFGVSPRLAERAAPAAFCCAADFAGMLAPPL